MITKTAWKNIWRNRIRSLVVIASVTIGIFCGVFAVGVMEGAMKQRVDSALDNEVSHIQITHPSFRENNDMVYTLDDEEMIRREIETSVEVEAVASRIVINGMANTASKSQGVIINGIVPSEEIKVFNLDRQLSEGTGSYFSADKSGGYAYIGVDLAKSLNIIRYLIDDNSLKELAQNGLPEDILLKLQPFSGQRFKNEKTFRRRLGQVLTPEETGKYEFKIRDAAMSYSGRSRLTLTFLDTENNLTGARFRIAGLFDIPNSIYEGSEVFVCQDQLRSLTGIDDNSVHKLIVRLKDAGESHQMAEKISDQFPGLQVMSWQQLQPDLAMMSEMTAAMYGFFMIIILAALAFGIVNTMLMVVLERTKELGMLTAIGMNKKKVFRMIMTESVLLSLTGGIAGMVLSRILIAVTSKSGISLSGMKEGFEGMGFSSVIYPEIGAGFFVVVVLLIIATGILSSVYPALKALKLDPAEALRTE